MSCVLAAMATLAQEPAAKPEAAAPPSEKPAAKRAADKADEKAALPFQIELLETHIRFEANGDSRKEVHTIVKINEIAGARQFSRLGFDYNRGFQTVDIPQVKITHANGGTSEILPSAISDAPNPIVEKFPAYQDVRVKSVRILGLQDGDTLEYRVITTTTKPPLAPDFWLEHSFDRSGQLLEEDYRLDVAKAREVRMTTSTELPASIPDLGENSNYTAYHWHVTPKNWPGMSSDSRSSSTLPDVVLSTFLSWGILSAKIRECMKVELPAETLAAEMAGVKISAGSARHLYDFVSSHIATVDVPMEITKCPLRNLKEVFSSGYGTSRDKARLLEFMSTGGVTASHSTQAILFYTKANSPETEIPRPSLLSGVLFAVREAQRQYFLDPGLEVAPFGMIRADVRGKKALSIWGCKEKDADCWVKIPEDLPFASSQNVNVDGSISRDGVLGARVRYSLRGDNELVLREAFHQTPKERWNEVAGLLALSDGFRGEITKVTASDPMETEKPFEVEYEITQAKFVDWSKKPVRIPALLPQIALPDAPKAEGKIDLGTPLEVETRLTLRLPEGTQVQTPPATSVTRDYATYVSKYDAHLNTLTATRHAHFLMREIAGDRAGDYNAFVRAAQIDQAQAIILFPNEEKK